MKVYCCGCQAEVAARLTNGKEIYPHRSDLFGLPFWKCDDCGNYVGCHHKTKAPTTPLGVIPTKEIMTIRKQIHALIDPLWKSGKMQRRHIYARLTEAIGKQYHTADIRTTEEGNKVLAIAQEIAA